jgi:hypothetical protein
VIRRVNPGMVGRSVVKLPPIISVLAITAYGLRFGASWLLLQEVPAERFDPHGFGLFGDAVQLAATAVPLGALLWWIISRRGPWRGLFAPAATRFRTVVSAFMLLVVGAPTLGQVWAMILLPFSACWPVVLSAVLWFAVVAVLRALAVTGARLKAAFGSGRLEGAVATGAVLTVVSLPFVVGFPEPPAFGHGAVAILAAFAVLSTTGISYRTTSARRIVIMRRAVMLLAVTVASIALRRMFSGDDILMLPTLDLLPKLFGLKGEDIDDAFIYETWLELWLACGLVVLLAAQLRRRRPVPESPTAWGRAPLDPPWNATTILLVLVGWAVLAGAVLDGHWTAAFLSSATRVTGEIADERPHPLIRFIADGAPLTFRQNGFVSRPVGAAVPVAYQSDDPARTARVDTLWTNWSDVLGMVWVGLGFTLHPFFGFRGTFRGSR